MMLAYGIFLASRADIRSIDTSIYQWPKREKQIKRKKERKKKETDTGRLGMCHCKIIEANKCTARHLKLWGNFSPSPSLGTTATHTPPLPASGGEKKRKKWRRIRRKWIVGPCLDILLQLCLNDSFAWYLMNLLSTQIFNYKMPGSNIDYSLKDYSKGNP